jgi:nitric oxide reductase NorQ protein
MSAAMSDEQPYYLAVGDEVGIFEAAYACRLPILLKGPTGCGKTRFVEHMAHKLRVAGAPGVSGNLITVACHEDLTGSDLVGRYLIKGDETIWVEVRSQAVRPAFCYLDEIVEARRTPPCSSTRSPTTGASCRSTSAARSSRRIATSCSWSPTTPATRASSRT